MIWREGGYVNYSAQKKEASEIWSDIILSPYSFW